MKYENVIAKRSDKTVYRDGDLKIKVYDETTSKVNVLVSALNQAKIEETGLNVPKLREVTTYEGKWVVVTDYIEGTPLDVLMKEHPEKLDEYLKMFVDLQATVHTKRAPGLLKIKEKMSMKISQTDFDDGLKYELHARLEGMPNHVKLCHGDFNPSNVIVKDNGELYIIDWSHATQGNASADVARTYLIFMLAGEEKIAEKYLSLFCEKTGISRSYYLRWLPIVAASQTVKKNESERELLNSWVNVVDFE
ncbi:MAG: aminoglycoside phosphotransferase family protein [Clostridia bacterium]|nr:aminoglycoside phosphotransferase family protein [Clostridia bacterium]MBR2944082.1 aminoglycoside phosphotransferase family protein [Clostridia bacterium]